MTDSLRDMPAYVRERDGQWQGADYQDGPWRLIPAPQKGAPWQPPATTQQPPAGDPTLSDRIARAVCPRRRAGASPCSAPCDDCRVVAAAAAHEFADYFSERYGGASNTADVLYAVGTHQPKPQAGWQPIGPGQEAAVDSVARELRRPNV